MGSLRAEPRPEKGEAHSSRQLWASFFLELFCIANERCPKASFGAGKFPKEALCS